MKILYVGYFLELNDRKLFCSPAADNLCSYVSDVLKRNNCDEIIILNIAKPKKHFAFFRSSVRKVNNITYVNSPSFGSGRLLSFLLGWMHNSWIKRFIGKNLNGNDCVIFYHSLNTLILEKFIAKQYNSILQVEEIYSEVYPQFSSFAKREYDCVNGFKKHIFVSKALRKNQKIISNHNVVLYGSYSCIEKKGSKRNLNQIIYSGNISISKGILTACDCMDYLPNYQLHIYGHGSPDEFRVLESKCRSKSNIFFHPAVPQNELEHILESFTIGINPLPNISKFDDLTFPSKILMYLKAGLNVVSSDLKSVKESPFGKLISFCKSNPESFAETIQGIKQGENEKAVEFIGQLDNEFQKDFFGLIGS